jgi:GDP-L-fucose synthase
MYDVVVKMLVLGKSGLVGSAVLRLALQKGESEVVGINSRDLDLRRRDEVLSFMRAIRPDCVVLAAAKVGGISANFEFPVDFLSNNLQIQTNVLDACHAASVERLVFLGSSCIYPRNADQPIKEESLLTGSLEPTNSAYAIAKIAGIELVKSYRKQFGHKWISLMPTNLYGPNDNYDEQTSHVFPSLIRKFTEATWNRSDFVELWGSGSPRREFLHADDLAQAIYIAIEQYDDDLPLNVGFGLDISVAELAEKVRIISGFQGRVVWNSNKPDGVPSKLLDSSRVQQLGFKPRISLDEGIEGAIQWFRTNFSSIERSQ